MPDSDLEEPLLLGASSDDDPVPETGLWSLLSKLKAKPQPNEQERQLINALEHAKTKIKRTWELPNKITVLTTALSVSAGAIVSLAVDTIVGSQPELKELVPPSKTRWGKFVTAVWAGGYIGAIPGLNIVGAPAAAAVQAWAEGKGKGNIARNVATAAGGGAIDSVAEIASGGAVAAIQLSTAAAAAVATIWAKAQYFYDEGDKNAKLFQSRATQLKIVVEKFGPDSRKSFLGPAEKYLEWLERQETKCRDRHAEFQQIANEFEAKAAEVKAKLESVVTKPGRAGYSKLKDEE